jgi:hypothetical protein
MTDTGNDDSGFGGYIPPAPDAPPAQAPPPQAPPYQGAPPQPQYQAAAPQYQAAPPGYQAAPPPGGYPMPQKTNTLAIVALVLGFLIPLGAWICGPIAIRQINRSNGMQKGKGLAIAGIIIGIALVVIVAAVSASSKNNTGNSTILHLLF